jgi:transcription antitermination factor NusG
MSSFAEYTPALTASSLASSIAIVPERAKWYAVHTIARHEKRVAEQLQEKRIFTFLPVLQQIHRWSDRLRKVDVPLFSCYAFVRIAPNGQNRLDVLQTKGVLGFVGSKGQGTSIADEEIEGLRTAMREKIPCVPHPFIESGKRVRIRGGCLDAIEGILERQGPDQSLVVSIELLRRSVSIRVDGYDIEAI